MHPQKNLGLLLDVWPEVARVTDANLVLVGRLVTEAALIRTESRGAHYRTDFPERDTSRDGRHTMLWPTQAPEAAREATHVIHA